MALVFIHCAPAGERRSLSWWNLERCCRVLVCDYTTVVLSCWSCWACSWVSCTAERRSDISSSFCVGVGNTRHHNGAEGQSCAKVSDPAKLARCCSRMGQTKLQTAPPATRVRPETFGTFDKGINRSRFACLHFQAQQTHSKFHTFPKIPP